MPDDGGHAPAAAVGILLLVVVFPALWDTTEAGESTEVHAIGVEHGVFAERCACSFL
ncbi:MAG: hypothetical protein ACRDRI_17435 [Pseudonocardiaceae bacterium]